MGGGDNIHESYYFSYFLYGVLSKRGKVDKFFKTSVFGEFFVDFYSKKFISKNTEEIF